VSGEIVIHSLAHARAALAAGAASGVAVTLASAPDAALQTGPLWFKAVVEQAMEAYPHVGVTAILDCGDQPGAVMAALRIGLKNLRFEGAETLRHKLAGMGAVFMPAAAARLDLLDIKEPEAACLAFLRRD
jgi:hypothetical protein